MIGLAVFLIVAALFGCFSAAAARANKHGLTLVFMLLSGVSAISSVCVYPISEKIESELRSQIESQRAQIMIETLGSPENYINYLKATD